ncbi:hypothetical protein D3C72_1320170 [compost metagenome]
MALWPSWNLTLKVGPARVVVPILTETGPVRDPGLTMALSMSALTLTIWAGVPLTATVGVSRSKPSPTMVIVVPIPPSLGVTSESEKPTQGFKKVPRFSS